MRIEKIGNDKIKVTLSAVDLMNFDIEVSDLRSEPEILHSFMFQIFEAIQEETDFDPFAGRVVVEATPMRDGVCIIVSRPKSLRPYIARKTLGQNIRVKAKVKEIKEPSVCYIKSFDDLCAMLTLLRREELVKLSLYKTSDVYCVLVEEQEEMSRACAVLSEYSTRRSWHPMQKGYVEEHGLLVAKGEKLADMADGIRSLL